MAEQGLPVPADHGDCRDLRVSFGDGDDVSERVEAGVVPGARGEPAGAAELHRPGVPQCGGEPAVGLADGQDDELDRITVDREPETTASRSTKTSMVRTFRSK